MIPLADLKAQYRSIKNEIDGAVIKVLESGQFILGDEVEKFEKEFADYCNVSHAVALNSGTSALHLALLAAGVGDGDEVITVPFTFVATVAAICYTGATPVFVDIDPESFTMDTTRLDKAITQRTKAILPVHLYGQPADMAPVLELARERNITVIEDAAQAHGAKYKGSPVGGLGDIGCFSFYPGKNLGAYGEGGMAVTNDPDYAHIMRILRDWGQEEKGYHKLKGYNKRMDGIQGAILRVKLRHLDDWTKARRACAGLYDRLLAGSEVQTPREMSYATHVYHVYAIRTKARDALKKHLLDGGTQTGIHYPLPVYMQPAYSDTGYSSGDFPHTEKAAKEVLSLPIYPELKREDIEKICKNIKENLKR